jgi:hypothetical protein
VGTVLKVAVGVLLGGLVLVGVAALLGVVPGGGGNGPGGGEKVEETDVDSILDAPEDTGAEGRQAKIDEWCNSESGDKIDQLGSAVAETGKKQKQITDAMLEVAEDAPPGAYCAVLQLDSARDTWNLYAGDPAWRKYRPTSQASRIREFQAEHDLKTTYDGP